MSELAIRRATTDTTPPGLLADVADLLSAIREALDIPPAATDQDERRRQAVLNQRASDVTVILRGLLKYPHMSTLARETTALREWTSQTPADYQAWTRSAE